MVHIGERVEKRDNDVRKTREKVGAYICMHVCKK